MTDPILLASVHAPENPELVIDGGRAPTIATVAEERLWLAMGQWNSLVSRSRP